MTPWEFLKRRFCKHDHQDFLENIYGDRINLLECRSVWKCKDCRKIIYSWTLSKLDHYNPNVGGNIYRYKYNDEFIEKRILLIDKE